MRMYFPGSTWRITAVNPRIEFHGDISAVIHLPSAQAVVCCSTLLIDKSTKGDTRCTFSLMPRLVDSSFPKIKSPLCFPSLCTVTLQPHQLSDVHRYSRYNPCDSSHLWHSPFAYPNPTTVTTWTPQIKSGTLLPTNALNASGSLYVFNM